ncbi:MAG: hypothetical protein JWP87_2031 [Labilithrix sp.]|nr:hypothetical protein [Labilithrix sp.]
MVRAALVGLTVAALALAPKSCAKANKPPPAPEPPVAPPAPVTSATTPPAWAPPETTTVAVATSAGTSAVPAVNPDLTKARTAADAKDFKKVRSLLEKKVRAGKGSPEEAQLVFRACTQLKDKACAEGVKAKNPDVTASD